MRFDAGPKQTYDGSWFAVIRVAIIGTGAIAPAHGEAYRTFAQRCEIVAVCDIFPEKARKFAERFGTSIRVVEDYRMLLGDEDIDLVSVCTPPYTHASIAIDFLLAGKHVLVEKPMAASLEECDQMLSAKEKSGRILSVVAQNRFRTDMMKLKGVLDSGVAGEIVHAQVDSYWWRGHSYYDLWWRGTWEREGGGCTLNHAVHHLDALQWMMGMPTEVVATMGNVSHDNAEVEDISIALLRFANGALGQATSSVVHHGQEQQMIFQGKNARVSVPWKLFASTSKPNGFPEEDVAKENEINTLYESLPEVPYERHIGQIDNLLTAIETGNPVLVDGAEGRNTLELITAIYKSATTARAVPLPLHSDDPFYRRESMLSHSIHFYEKSTSVNEFSSNEITS